MKEEIKGFKFAIYKENTNEKLFECVSTTPKQALDTYENDLSEKIVEAKEREAREKKEAEVRAIEDRVRKEVENDMKLTVQENNSMWLGRLIGTLLNTNYKYERKLENRAISKHWYKDAQWKEFTIYVELSINKQAIMLFDRIRHLIVNKELKETALECIVARSESGNRLVNKHPLSKELKAELIKLVEGIEIKEEIGLCVNNWYLGLSEFKTYDLNIVRGIVTSSNPNSIYYVEEKEILDTRNFSSKELQELLMCEKVVIKK